LALNSLIGSGEFHEAITILGRGWRPRGKQIHNRHIQLIVDAFGRLNTSPPQDAENFFGHRIAPFRGD